MKTLVLIDVQNDFMPGGALAVPEGDKIIAVINAMIGKFDLVVATQDWHPASHKSFASNHLEKEIFQTIDLNGLEQKLWPNHCVQGTKGAEFHPDLEMKAVEAIFRKGMDPEVDSYSGFYDNGRRKSTGLAGYLKKKAAGELFFCGLAADICVYFSMMDSLKEGFSTTFIEDASKPLDADNFENVKSEMQKKGIKIISTSALKKN
ncbi:MAG TPA: bifunctional nicotinamidase/pyrazinamidase [Salinimicrobium sp.]|nr:bifunctional nicotinamidase/pyrazinamidase [Salinimicrobium sp.]